MSVVLTKAVAHSRISALDTLFAASITSECPSCSSRLRAVWSISCIGRSAASVARRDLAKGVLK